MGSARDHLEGDGAREPGRDTWLSVGVVLFMIATTVSYASTTLSSRAFIEPVRLLALAGAMGIFMVAVLTRLRLARTVVLGTVVFLFYLCYGLALAAVNGGMIHVAKQLYADVVLTLVGISLFSSLQNGILSRQAVLWYLSFASGVFVLTVAVGGFTMTYPPQFTFDYLASEAGQGIYYSQGASKFFGLAGIAAIFLAFATRSRVRRLAYFVICLGALGLSLIGGARGDSAAAALVVLVYSIYRSPGSLVLWIVGTAVAVLLLQDTILLEDFMIFNRLMNIQEDAGVRGTLLHQAARLLAERPDCLTVGCGFGFFQSYFDRESGMHPHNIYLEALIVWGVPIVLIATVLGISGLVVYVRKIRGKPDAFLLFLAYFALVFLKSGTVLASWFVVAGAVSFMATALDELLGRHALSPRDALTDRTST